jgi:Ca2+-dependent lipid-binding protein
LTQDYKLEEGNYLISIRLLEASDLIPRSASGVANPYCVVKVMDKYEKTRTSKKTLSPLWDQNFAFEFPNLKKSDLEAATITFEIFDRQFLIFSESLGRYEIDLTTVYYQKYHQYYMTWFTLADSGDAKQGVQGYVKANIDVLGPNDKPHVNEKITEDSTSQTVVSSKLKQLGHLIIAEVFRGEHIVPMNVTKKTVDAYVKVNYGGCTSRSDYVNETNPTWNEILYLGTMLPNHSKNVQIEVWNRNTIFKDDLIGTSLIPFNSFMGILDLPSMWVNIYGPPLCGIGEKAEEMALHGFKKGSCYRGRVLMRVSFVSNSSLLSFKRIVGLDALRWPLEHLR